MISVIGPNPAIDVLIDVPAFHPYAVSRSVSTRYIAGGKPVNVARAIRRLGSQASLIVPLGPGHRLITDAASELGISLTRVPVAEPVRHAYVIVAGDGTATVVNEPGPRLGEEEARHFMDVAEEAAVDAVLSVASGSLPPGLPIDFYGHLSDPAIIDTSGGALREAIAAGVWAIKVNGDEIADATGIEDPLEAARAALAHGVRHVVVTLGHAGAIYLGRDGEGEQVFRVGVAPVEARNPTAAGDAFLAGLAVALERGSDWREALRMASATAGLAAGALGPDIGPQPDVTRLMLKVPIETLG